MSLVLNSSAKPQEVILSVGKSDILIMDSSSRDVRLLLIHRLTVEWVCQVIIINSLIVKNQCSENFQFGMKVATVA